MTIPVSLPLLLLRQQFSPRSLPGLVLWLSAAREAARRGLAPGQSVALDTWLDLSGRGNSPSQATASKRPVLQHDGTRWVVRFDGVNDVLLTPAMGITQPFVAVFVHVWTPVTTDLQYLWGTIQPVGVFRLSRWTVFAGKSGPRGSDTQNTPIVATAVFNGASSRAFENRVLWETLDAGSVNLSGAVGIGNRSDEAWPISQDVMAFLLYSRALSDAERKRVERYLDREARLGLNL